jgi:hypothetical protein
MFGWFGTKKPDPQKQPAPDSDFAKKCQEAVNASRVRSSSSYQVAETYSGLRDIALRTNRERPAKSDGGPVPFGILMETGHPKAVVTLAAFDSGDASLYFSNGGGVLGGIGHETVRTAAVSFVESSRALLPSMSKTQETPLPPVGVVRFYVLTGDGIFTAEAPENELGNGGSCLSPLFYAGCDVITQLRLVTETPRRYEGKPLLMLLESYILDCIGQLPAEKEAGLPPIVQRLYGGGEDWKATLRTLG